MAEWTGKWYTNEYYEKCDCGNEKGIRVITKTFDADHIDAMIHDGEVKEEREYLCAECRRKAEAALKKTTISWEDFIKNNISPNGELKVER